MTLHVFTSGFTEKMVVQFKTFSPIGKIINRFEERKIKHKTQEFKNTLQAHGFDKHVIEIGLEFAKYQQDNFDPKTKNVNVAERAYFYAKKENKKEPYNFVVYSLLTHFSKDFKAGEFNFKTDELKSKDSLKSLIGKMNREIERSGLIDVESKVHLLQFLNNEKYRKLVRKLDDEPLFIDGEPAFLKKPKTESEITYVPKAEKLLQALKSPTHLTTANYFYQKQKAETIGTAPKTKATFQEYLREKRGFSPEESKAAIAFLNYWSELPQSKTKTVNPAILVNDFLNSPSQKIRGNPFNSSKSIIAMLKAYNLFQSSKPISEVDLLRLTSAQLSSSQSLSTETNRKIRNYIFSQIQQLKEEEIKSQKMAEIQRKAVLEADRQIAFKPTLEATIKHSPEVQFSSSVALMEQKGVKTKTAEPERQFDPLGNSIATKEELNAFEALCRNLQNQLQS